MSYLFLSCTEIKVNALTEPQLIAALYRASQAGVRVDLIIRSICCLIPQVQGMSENIRVRSIVGRFLEHTRVYFFEHGGEKKLYCASADWMGRNLFSRVETCFPILDRTLKKQIYKDGLISYLNDCLNAWELQADGHWLKVACTDPEQRYSAQQHLVAQKQLKI